MYYHQGLINLLYSVKKLNNNEDLLMFDRFVLEQYSFDQFVSFLTYREIFQSLTKIIIFGTSVLIKKMISSELTLSEYWCLWRWPLKC